VFECRDAGKTERNTVHCLFLFITVRIILPSLCFTSAVSARVRCQIQWLVSSLCRSVAAAVSWQHLFAVQHSAAQCSTPSSFAGLCTAVVLIRETTIVVIFVHRGVGPSLFRGHSCAGARSSSQQPACLTSYCLSERRIDSTFKQKYPPAQAHSRSNMRYWNIDWLFVLYLFY
jgi:hypothetical protein